MNQIKNLIKNQKIKSLHFMINKSHRKNKFLNQINLILKLKCLYYMCLILFLREKSKKSGHYRI